MRVLPRADIADATAALCHSAAANTSGFAIVRQIEPEPTGVCLNAPPMRRAPYFWRKPALQSIPPHMRIIGKGEIGDKARILAARVPRLMRIGFHFQPTITLAEDVIDLFLTANDLGPRLKKLNANPETRAAILHGSVPEQIQRIFSAILERNLTLTGGKPLAVRSSAIGDAHGTGIYKSVIAPATMPGLEDAFSRVLASFFGPDAIAFRGITNTPPGFGIMIMPLVGQTLTEDGLFGPVLSGHGYTSTPGGDGYVRIVPGLGGGVSSRDSFKVTRAEALEAKGLLKKLLMRFAGTQFDLQYDQKVQPVRVALLGPDFNKNKIGLKTPEGIVWQASPAPGTPHLQRVPVALTPEILALYEHLDLLPLFQMMADMERSFRGRRPHYFEWAMTLDASGPRFYILQDANVNPTLDWVDFGDSTDASLTGRCFVGGTVPQGKLCQGLVVCLDGGLDQQRAHNLKNAGYILLYPANVVTQRDRNRIGFADISNGSVALEFPDGVYHVTDIESHWGGALRQAEIILGALDVNPVPGLKEKFPLSPESTPNFLIFPGRFLVQASEAQGRVQIYKIED